MLRLVLLLSLLCACALADQKVARLFVLNSTPDLKFGQSSAPIVPENVAGVLGHVMGLSGLNPLPEVSISTPKTANQAKASLLVVVDGAPVQGFSELDQSKLASFDVESSADESNTELLSRMFGAKGSADDSDNANLGDLLCQLHDNSLVLTLSAQSDLLESVSLHDQLVRKNPNWNVLRGQYDAKKSKLNLHGKGENALKEAIEDLFTAEGIEAFNVKTSEGKDVFDETLPVDELFLIEMKALSQLLQALGEAKTLLNDASPDFVVFVSSSLRGLREKYGVESVQFITALSKLNSLLSQIQEQVGETFANQAIFEVLLLDAHQRTVLLRERRAIAKRDYTNIASQCFTSLQQCINSTSNCSSEGNCTFVKNIKQETETVPCYRCKCSAQYAGESCEFINIVAPFHIIFWVSLTLILALILISYALAFMDPGTDTLLFKTASGRSKKE